MANSCLLGELVDIVCGKNNPCPKFTLLLQTNLIEKHLEECLKQRMPDFSMEEFMKSLQYVFIKCMGFNIFWVKEYDT